MTSEISRKLDAIKDEKQEIRASILGKGVLVGEEFRTYSEAIDDIDTTPELEEKTITENGEYFPSEGIYGISKVNVNVQSKIFSSFDGEKVYDSIEDAEELNLCDCFGALLWKRNSDNKLVLTNGHKEWDPNGGVYTQPVKDGHTLYSVCCGLGKFAVLNFPALAGGYAWSNKLSQSIDGAKNMPGYESTKAVLAAFGSQTKDGIWALLQERQYIPSIGELMDILTRCRIYSWGISITQSNIGKLIGIPEKWMWCSTQSLPNAGSSYLISSANANIMETSKTTMYGTEDAAMALIHFGAL